MNCVAARRTVFSKCRRYRYVLWRQWDEANPAFAMFIGLNPSTADEVKNDPTIRRCIDYAKRWGYGGVCVVNLFAYRATKLSALKNETRPIGQRNDRWLRQLAPAAAIVIAAWGVNGTLRQRDEIVQRFLGANLMCLKTTRHGHPAHPLYLKKTLRPRPFSAHS